jgi:cytochrome c-type biogenesis protein CcmH
MNSSQNLFWFIGGAMTSAAALVVAFPFFRRLHQTGSRTRLGLATVGAVAAAAIIATGLYRLWGNPAGLSVTAPSIDMAAAAPHPGAAADSAGAAPIGSVEAATLKLAERLNAKGGTSAEWQLLAQGYEFMGRAEDAKRARDHAGAAPNSAAAGSTAAPNSTAPARAAPPVVSAEGNKLLAEAEKYRVARDYPHAVDAYKRLVRMHAMTADAWANYADAVASSNGGKLSGAPGDFLAEALRLDPDHPKALWLEASMLHEQHRYPEAVGVWQHLASILPAGSSDAKIIAANIDEAQRLSGAAAPPTAAQDAARPAQISGEVDIDPALRSKALPSSTLFVFAKAADSPGPPLAVVRTSVDQWPMKFLLNDSQAMMPQRKLSDFQRVIVEARISQSGQPMGQRGDLQGSSGALDPKSDKPIRVVIRDVIG